MKISEMLELFEKYEDFCSDLVSIENPLSKRRDLHVLLLLDSLLDTDTDADLMDMADNDIVYFHCSLDELAQNITEQHIKELCQCGVFIAEDQYLAMFVYLDSVD